MIYAIAAVLVLILDQGLKYWVTVNIALNTGSIPIIPGMLELVNIHNTGAAFGILPGGGWRWIFVVIALVFVVIAVYAIKRGLIRGAVGRWAVVGVVAGAIGNCIDRVLNGYVVDMFKPTFLEGTVFGAIFNVADIFISCCGVLFCLYILFSREYKTVKSADADDFEERPAKKSRPGLTMGSRVRTGGSHAKGPGNTRRVPAREARSERPLRPAAESAPERTRIPVQQPRPARRPAQDAQPARRAAPANPFAEWESGAAQPSAPAAAEPAVSAPAADAKASQPAKKPESAAHEFTLEEILAEFSDK